MRTDEIHEQLRHLEKLRRMYKGNLRKLQFQQAQYAIDLPTHILNAISITEEKIIDIQTETNVLNKEIAEGSPNHESMDRHTLEAFVSNQIIRRVGLQDKFTAYDITLSLRSEHPSLRILHEVVREFVHSKMNLFVRVKLYRLEKKNLGGNLARLYLPEFAPNNDNGSQDIVTHCH